METTPEKPRHSLSSSSREEPPLAEAGGSVGRLEAKLVTGLGQLSQVDEGRIRGWSGARAEGP